MPWDILRQHCNWLTDVSTPREAGEFCSIQCLQSAGLKALLANWAATLEGYG